MSGSLKLGIYLFLTVLGLFLAVQVVKLVMGLLLPLLAVLAVAGVIVIVLAVTNRKSLGAGRRRILP